MSYESRRRERKRKRQRRKKILFTIEILVLVLLSLVLVAAIWATHKFSLINHEELDQDKLKTADEVNANSNDSGNDGQGQTDSNLSGVELIALVGIDSRDEMEGENSDTMIIACIDHTNKTIRLASLYRDTYLNIGEDYDGTPDCYTKANAAYNYGGATQFLSMLNLNFDLNITEYMTVNFKALSDVVQALGGLDIDMTREEVIHLNNYNVETSAACGLEYEELSYPSAEEFDGAMTLTFHLNGSQAVSYARIRKTAGNDFRRTSRQRLVLEKIMEKAKTADLGTLNSIMDQVFPQITTNLDNSRLISMIQPVLGYTFAGQTGFPFTHLEDTGELTGEDCVLPVTLEYNAILLHQFLFPDTEYSPSETVQSYSATITAICGYGEDSIELAQSNEDNAEIPIWDPTAEAQGE